MKNKTILKRPVAIISAIVLAVLISFCAVIIITAQDKATFAGVQLATDGNINLRFYYDNVDDVVTHARVTVSDADNGGEEFFVELTTATNGNGQTVTYFQVPLAAAQMGCDVKVEPCDDSGRPVCTDESNNPSMSVREYAERVLADEQYARVYPTIKAILNYGQFAAQYFSDDVANDVNVSDGLFARETNPVLAMTQYLKAGEAPKITVNEEFAKDIPIDEVELRVALENSISLNLYYNYYGDSEAVTGELVEQTDTYKTYRVSVKNIDTTHYDVSYHGRLMVVVNGEIAVTVSENASVMSCLQALVSKDDTRDLALAMYNYYHWTASEIAKAEGEELAALQAACSHNMHYEYTTLNSGVARPVCTYCGLTVEYEINDNINFFSAPGQIINVWGTSNTPAGGPIQKDENGQYLGYGDTAEYIDNVFVENGVAYTRVYIYNGAGIIFGNGQISPNKATHNENNGTASDPLTGGMGKYAVIKLRSDKTKEYRLSLITDKITTDSTSDATTMGSTNRWIGATNGEFVTYVIDVSKLADPDATTVRARIKFLSSTAEGEYLDIAYFAICGSLEEVATIIEGDATANYISNWNNTAPTVKHTATHTECTGLKLLSTETENGNVLRTYECSNVFCGKQYVDHAVPESIGFYSAPGNAVNIWGVGNSATDNGNKKNLTDVRVDADGTIFTRAHYLKNNRYLEIALSDGKAYADVPEFSGAAAGTNTATESLNGDKVGYVVFKIRSNGADAIAFGFRTDAANGAIVSVINTFRKAETFSDVSDGEWHTYVIDYTQDWRNYGDATKVRIALGYLEAEYVTADNVSVDIAYAANCETLTEVYALIGDDDSIFFHNSFVAAPTGDYKHYNNVEFAEMVADANSCGNCVENVIIENVQPGTGDVCYTCDKTVYKCNNPECPNSAIVVSRENGVAVNHSTNQETVITRGDGTDNVCYVSKVITTCTNDGCDYRVESAPETVYHKMSNEPTINGTTYAYCCVNEGCTKVYGSISVPENINYFSAPGQLVNNWACANAENPTGSGLNATKTLLNDVRVDEDGTVYTRVHLAGNGSFFMANGTTTPSAQVQDTPTDTLDGGLGQYFVMKIRNNGCSSINWGFMTELKKNYVTWSAIERVASTHTDLARDGFNVYVIDLGTWRGLEASEMIQVIMRGNGGTSVDVAYFANCKTLAEVYSLIGDDENIVYDVRWDTSTYGAGYGEFTNAQFAEKAGVCINHVAGAPTVSGNTYTYYCKNTGCDKVVTTLTIPEGLNYYSAPGQGYNIYAAPFTVVSDENGVYTHVAPTGSSGMLVLGNGTVSKQTDGIAADKLNNGLGKYLVIKVRNNGCAGLRIGLRTDIYNTATPKPEYINYSGIWRLSTMEDMSDGEFHTYLMDIEYLLDTNEGATLVQIAIGGPDGSDPHKFASGVTFDVAYVANCSTLADVAAVVGEDDVLKIASWNSTATPELITNEQLQDLASGTCGNCVSDTRLENKQLGSGDVCYTYDLITYKCNNPECPNYSVVLSSQRGIEVEHELDVNTQTTVINGSANDACYTTTETVTCLNDGCSYNEEKAPSSTAHNWTLDSQDGLTFVHSCLNEGCNVTLTCVGEERIENKTAGTGEVCYKYDVVTYKCGDAGCENHSVVVSAQRGIEVKHATQTKTQSNYINGAASDSCYTVAATTYCTNDGCDYMVQIDPQVFDHEWKLVSEDGLNSTYECENDGCNVTVTCVGKQAVENKTQGTGDVCYTYDLVTYKCTDPDCPIGNYHAVADAQIGLTVYHNTKTNTGKQYGDENDPSVCYATATVTMCSNDGCQYKSVRISNPVCHQIGAPAANGSGYSYTCTNSLCGKQISVNVPEGTNYFSAPGQQVNAYGTGNVANTAITDGAKLTTVMTENGVVFSRIYMKNAGIAAMANGVATASKTNHGEGAKPQDPLSGGLGQFLVFKIRAKGVPNVKLNIVKSTSAGGARQAISGVGSATGGAYTIRNEVPGEFVTYVVQIAPDASATHIHAIIGVGTDSKAGIVVDSGAYIDLAYFAVCDSWVEVDALVGDDSIKFLSLGTNWSTTTASESTNIILNSAAIDAKVFEETGVCGSCVSDPRITNVQPGTGNACYTYDLVTYMCNNPACAYYRVVDTSVEKQTGLSMGHSLGLPVYNGTSFTYTCNNSGCANKVTTLIVPAGTNFYSAPGQVVNNWACANVENPTGSGFGTNKVVLSDIRADADGTVYTRIHMAGAGSAILANGTIDPSAQKENVSADALNGGLGRYIIIKFRNNGCNAIRWGFRTNLVDDGTKTDTCVGWTGTWRTTDHPGMDGEFYTFILDLGTWRELENSTTIQMIIGGGDDKKGVVPGSSIDIAYVANCDTLAEVYSVIGKDDNIIFDARWDFTSYSAGYGEFTNEEFVQTYKDVVIPSYGNGEEIASVGIDWSVGAFADTTHTIDKSVAETISASALLEKLRSGSMTAGEVWRVTEQIVLPGSATYRANGAAIIAEGGILIENAVDIRLENVIIEGSLTIKNSAELAFNQVDIKSIGTAVNIDANSSDILFNNCRLYANNVAIKSNADYLVVYSSYLRAPYAAQLKGDYVTVQNCKIFATESAVSIEGESVIVRENTITALNTGVGVTVESGSVNALVALNDITDVQRSIVVNDAYNTSVVVNRAINIYGTYNTNLYVVDNSLGGSIELVDNNYLIIDGNDYPEDGFLHTLINKGNNNFNGNDITDVDARVEVGANEALLPHTNKELFVGMHRQTTVRDASMTTAKGLAEYLEGCAKNSDVVIVPPGAYSVPFGSDGYGVLLDASASNTTIYAYGVYSECSETEIQNYGRGSNNEHNSTYRFYYYIYGAKNLNIYGLTAGVAIPSSGQVRVVDKKVVNGAYQLTVIADAGFMDGFTKANPETFHASWPETFIYDATTGEYKLYPEENPDTYHTCVDNGDGTYTITLTNKDTDLNGTIDPSRLEWTAKEKWERITLGSVMTCRYAYGDYHFYILNSSDVLVRDFTLYGYAGAMANVAMGTDNVTYERFHNALHSDSLIDKATYEKYLAIEQKWGVDMEIRQEILEDGTVRYRGPASRSCTVDAFHITSTKTGYNVISSLLEGMVDDGANTKANSSRLYDIVDNGDGTVTITFRDTMYKQKWNGLYSGGSLGVIYCRQFAKGDTVFIYAPSGMVLCETPALTDAVKLQSHEYTYSGGPKDGPRQYSVTANVYSVTVAESAINWDALKVPSAYSSSSNEYKYAKSYSVGTKLYNHITVTSASDRYYDLSSYGEIVDASTDSLGEYYGDFYDSQLLNVDNLSWNACNYTMDNVMVRNGHSRGFLIKSTDVKIKHCTFNNVSYAGLLIKPEVNWAESTVARRVLIEDCLFDNTGYMSNMLSYKEYACITICSTSTIANEDTLPIDDITITGCKFTNNKQQNAIYINSAKNITITNNTFDDTVADYKGIKHNGCAVLLETCMNIEISGNTYNYSHYNGNIRNVVYGTNYKNIFGTDVTGAYGNKLIPDNVK